MIWDTLSWYHEEWNTRPIEDKLQAELEAQKEDYARQVEIEHMLRAEIARLKALLAEASTFFSGGRLTDEINEALKTATKAAQPQKGENDE
jgi:hypothetical protein